MKTISFELSEKSIEKAIQEIEAYKAELQKKCKIFLARLIEAGFEVADATLAAVIDDEKKDTHVNVVWESDNSVSLVMRGEKFLFVEFGAGIAFSQPQNPLNDVVTPHMGLGTYPSKHPELRNAYKEEGWWYTEDGQPKHSRGNAPYMPMYKADVEITRQLSTIAKEVFGG